jgi:hypothetical protein
MQLRQYIGTFVLIALLMLVIELVGLASSVSGAVIVTALCVAAGGTLGVAYRRHRMHHSRSPNQ